jgi:multisubunit Na+/H+ antiporter MnhG subunit
VVALVLLGVAVLAVLVAVLGLVAMRDVNQMLHFPALVSDVAGPCVAVAVALDGGDLQAVLKGAIIAAVLFAMNAVLTHATARAARFRGLGRVRVEPKDHVELLGRR